MLNRFAADYLDTLGSADFRPAAKVSGRLASYDGLLMEAVGLSLPVGTVCRVGTEAHGCVDAEIIGFRNGRTLMMNLGGPAALLPKAPVRPLGPPGEAEVGAALLGRVVDGAGKPIDGLGPIRGAGRWPLAGNLQSPLDRGRVLDPLDVGVRAINGLLTVGQGQRVGIMAGSGVGKSVLLGMIVRAAEADVIVIGLIGERSREVADFLETKVAGDARTRSVVVAVPANHSPVLRIRGALRATAIAEAFRAEGKKVLLIMDSLTRVAHAGREIGLALGEPASARGYPPSAIAMLPNLIERAGTDVRSGGSITAIYTVLADGDDGNDPVVDSARSILDGHIVLSPRARRTRRLSCDRCVEIRQPRHDRHRRACARQGGTRVAAASGDLRGEPRSRPDGRVSQWRRSSDRCRHRVPRRDHGIRATGCRRDCRAGRCGRRTDRCVRRTLRWTRRNSRASTVSAPSSSV